MSQTFPVIQSLTPFCKFGLWALWALQLTDIFPNDENYLIGNWQIATDTIITNFKGQRQNFQWGCIIHFVTNNKSFALINNYKIKI